MSPRKCLRRSGESDKRSISIGRSVRGQSIQAFLFGPRSARAKLILAGVHGDEPKTVYVARQLVVHLAAHPLSPDAGQVCVVPVVNPDGYVRRKRRNGAQVDLNRNMPTQCWEQWPQRNRYYGGPRPASEPETRALIRLIERLEPAWIISLHSITLDRQCNNYNGPARSLARKLSAINQYPINDDIGYPTPGSLGTWAGAERRIPTVTLELPSRTSRERDWRVNLPALMAVIERAKLRTQGPLK